MNANQKTYCLDVIIHPDNGINPDEVRQELRSFLSRGQIGRMFGLSLGRYCKVPGPDPIKILRIETEYAEDLARFLILNWKTNTYDGSQFDYKIYKHRDGMINDDKTWLDDVDFVLQEIPATNDGNIFIVLP